MNGLPFELKLPRPNTETIAAIEECEKMIASGNFKRYSNTKEMIADILAGEDDDDV